MKTKTAVWPARHVDGDRAADERLSARKACGPEISCRLLGAGSFDCWALRVQNLSAGGISVLLDRVVPTGKVLTVELHNHLRRSSLQRLIRVIYSLQIPSGGLMMGASFCPKLDDDELAGLLSSSASIGTIPT